MQGIKFLAASAMAVVMLNAQAADYAAVAQSRSGTQLGWSQASTQVEADRAALLECNRLASKKDKDPDCEISSKQGGIALAKSPSHTGFAMGKSLSEAKKEALKACGDKDCKIEIASNKPGIFVYSKSDKDSDGNAKTYLAYSYLSGREAVDDAVAGCTEKGGGNCAIRFMGFIPGPVVLANAEPEPRPAPTRVSEGNCRPRSNSIRCSSSCTNGDCVVTYENGCKMRVQVQPKFDPFDNQWKYPSPSC